MADAQFAARATSLRPPAVRFAVDGVARVVVTAAAIAAVGISVVITLATEQQYLLPSLLAQVLIPGLIALCLVLGRSDRAWPMLAALVLLEVEAVLGGWLFDVGVAFAILFPLIGIGLVHPHMERGRLSLLYASAGFAAFVGVGLALTVGGNAEALGRNAPWLTTLEFGALITIALALLWRAGERRRAASAAEQAALEARVDAQRDADRVQQTLLTLVDRSPIATYTLDADGRVETWNPACASLFGWAADEVIGGPEPEGLWVPADDDTDFPIVTARRRDGSLARVELFTTAEPAGEDCAPRRILQVIDVTAREAEELHRRQAARTEAVGRLAGGIAHDFNNMLNAIRGYTVLAQSEMAPDAPGSEELDEVVSATDRAAALVRDLLAFSRAREHGMRVVAPAAQAGALAPMLRLLVGRSVDVAVEDHSDGACVRVDPGQLDQVLVNLAINARDAMPAGGRLAIRTLRPAQAATVRIEVEDTGTGMEPAVAARIFEPYFTTKGEGAGTGLGLANALDIVRDAGGTMDVVSVRGAGTTFRIDLPIADAA